MLWQVKLSRERRLLPANPDIPGSPEIPLFPWIPSKPGVPLSPISPVSPFWPINVWVKIIFYALTVHKSCKFTVVTWISWQTELSLEPSPSWKIHPCAFLTCENIVNSNNSSALSSSVQMWSITFDSYSALFPRSTISTRASFSSLENHENITNVNLWHLR